MRKSEHSSSSGKSNPNPRVQGNPQGAPQSDLQTPYRVDPERRQHMIEETAYFLAEHRGFGYGDPVQDWLTAEAEIDDWLSANRPVTSEEAIAYVRLRDEVRKAFLQIQDLVDAAALKSAFELAMDEAKRLENAPVQVMQKAAGALRIDMLHASERMGPAWERFSEHSAGLFAVWKDRGSDFLGRSAHAVREWLQRAHREEHRGPEH